MSIERIDLNPDLKKLWNEGFDLQETEGFLLVHNVPYLNSAKNVKRGILVSVLSLSGDRTIKPENHVAYFIGECPCNSDGSKINIVIGSDKTTLLKDVIIDHTLSGKADYQDYYEKIWRYIRIITDPVNSIDDQISPRTFQVREPENEEDSVFNYVDSNSSRAGINVISDKLKEQRIAIVGLGGTGSYLLDFISKTPVKEIHLYDKDYFLQHNAFRAPGATAKSRLFEHLTKTEYLKGIYSEMHKYVFSHPYNIVSSNVHELSEVDFVFLCMDSGKAKEDIINYLVDNSISFIDTGIGLENIDGALKGQIRVTTSTPDKREHIQKRISFAETEGDLYSQNIQIAELNAFNASLAIIKWKKLLGFYKDLDKEFNTTYVLYTNETTNEDFPL